MPLFKYEAVKRNGEKLNGSVDLPNEAEVRVFLRSQGARPIKIQSDTLLNTNLSIPFFETKVTAHDLAIVTKQLSIMISAGVPILQALDILQSGERNPKLKKALAKVSESISGGSPLWEALSKQGKIFDHLFVYLVRAGEMGGALDEILKRLSKYLEDNVKLMRMVKGAMVYPIAIIVVGVSVTIGLLMFVVPKFEAMLTGSGNQMPWLTAQVISFSHFFSNNFMYIAAVTVGAFFAFKSYINTPTGEKFWDNFLLRLPVFGDIILKGSVARFARTMGTMLSSGVNLIDAIDICKMTIGNVVIETALNSVKDEISAGKSMALPLAQKAVFPPMVIQMINVGENTGSLDQMLLKISEYYELEVEAAVGAMTKLIEPIVLVVLGGITAVILIAMYLPIFSISNTAG